MTAQVNMQTHRTTSSRAGRGHGLLKALLAAGGLVAAFGAASCCALPIALSLVGISAASLLGIGYLAARYQPELFCAAAVLLAASVIVMWRQRRRLAGGIGACQPGTSCAGPVLDWTSKIALALAVGLLALTFWIEPPV